MTTHDWCLTCRERIKLRTHTECAICARRRAFGLVIGALTCEVDEPPYARSTLDALDAIADLLGERSRARREHNRELREESRAAQRDARDAFAEGKAEGMAVGREDW